MAFPFEFKFTYTVSDKNVYAAIMDVLTPNKDVLFVPEFTWLNLLVAVWIVGSVIYILWVMIKYYKAVKALKAPICQRQWRQIHFRTTVIRIHPQSHLLILGRIHPSICISRVV